VLHEVVIQPLKQITDSRGKVMHMLRADSPLFSRFGEIYFSVVNPGAVKAWKRHRRMTQHLTVPVGRVRFALYDLRDASPSRGALEVVEIGEDHYQLLRIPPRVWYGFQGLGDRPSLIANCADLPHDPSEAESREPFDPGMPLVWHPTPDRAGSHPGPEET
jgi:dTDP-4-dehydrorhamnose 3,5-epimerase